ncbi:MAG: histidine--tRNA ligase [Candidatus Omnitrophota bacterium]|nr:histidine--tRNA ligase [Candidatus Omnitrophota bacterium]
MIKTYAGIRGTVDFDPASTRLFNKISQKARLLFELFGYKEIILPVLEEEGVFIRGVGEITDIVEKQIFRITNRSDSDTNIVLRPEGTAQVIRYYVENSLYKQSDFHKFSYVGPMFRGERPQKGRFRQFNHIGAESIGSDDFHLDAEIINLSINILESIGITDKELKINSLGCVRDKENFSRALKQGLDAKRNELCQDCQRRLDKNPLRVVDCKEQKCKSVIAMLKLGQGNLCDDCKKNFNDLLGLLDILKIQYTYAPHLVRGLDYYTNTVFEITSKGLGSQDAIGAGGRYNNLVKDLGGPDIAAIGFALGIERILLLLKATGDEEKIKVFVATTNKSLSYDAFNILKVLREEKISCDTDYCGKSLKGQLRYAEKLGTRFVVIVGDEELKEGMVVLKDMTKSTQEKIKIDNLVATLKNIC